MTDRKLAGAASGELLSELLIREGMDVDFPCAGNHTCGKCKVRARGSLSPISASEAAMLTADEIEAGLRMACFAKVFGPVEVCLPERQGEQIMAHGKGTVSVGEPMIACGSYGAAIDIGTTTVVCKLYDHSGRELGVESELNAQRAFGADVISRINYGIMNGNEIICQAVVSQLETMLGRLAKGAGVPRHKINRAVVTGNTTMLHFFVGLDPKGIGFVPFIPESLFGCEVGEILSGVEVYIPPCVSAYVGADLACCLLASGMCAKKESSLIIDIGTNGEMALFKEGRLRCCSTAASPAFEGAGISCGMAASAGAIAHARLEGESISYDTIGGAEARGICGSGIVDITAALLEAEALLSSGRLERKGSAVTEAIDEENGFFTFPGSRVKVTQEDIRKVQMAKAAINAGVMTLSAHCEIEPEEIDVLYLCGGFGSFLNLFAAEKIGLIPPKSVEHTVVLGNGAISGAAALLLDKKKINDIKALIDSCGYIELSGSEKFMDYYIGSMSFGEEEEE